VPAQPRRAGDGALKVDARAGGEAAEGRPAEGFRRDADLEAARVEPGYGEAGAYVRWSGWAALDTWVRTIDRDAVTVVAVVEYGLSIGDYDGGAVPAGRARVELFNPGHGLGCQP
jgi:hypothetical protein